MEHKSFFYDMLHAEMVHICRMEIIENASQILLPLIERAPIKMPSYGRMQAKHVRPTPCTDRMVDVTISIPENLHREAMRKGIG